MATAPTGAVPVKTYEPVLARKVSPPTLDFTCNWTDGAAGFSLAPAKGVGAELFGVTGVVSVSGATAVGASSGSVVGAAGLGSLSGVGEGDGASSLVAASAGAVTELSGASVGVGVGSAQAGIPSAIASATAVTRIRFIVM